MKKKLFFIMACILFLDAVGTPTVYATESGNDVVEMQQAEITAFEDAIDTIDGADTTDGVDAAIGTDISIGDMPDVLPVPEESVTGGDILEEDPADYSIEGREAPKFTVTSIDGKVLNIHVVNPSYVDVKSNNYTYYIQLGRENAGTITEGYQVRGMEEDISTYVGWESEVPEKFTIRICLAYKWGFSDITYSKWSKMYTGVTGSEYEQNLKLEMLNTTVTQGDESKVTLANVKWSDKTAYHHRRLSFKVKSAPKGSEPENIVGGFQYDDDTRTITFRRYAWGGIKEGTYTIEASAYPGTKDASKVTFKIKVVRSFSRFEVSVKEPRVYKKPGKTVTIKPILKIYDHGGFEMPAKAVPVYWDVHVRAADEEKMKGLYTVDNKTGAVTLHKDFGKNNEEITFFYYISDTEDQYKYTYKTLTVYSTPNEITRVTLGGFNVEMYQDVTIPACDVWGQKIGVYSGTKLITDQCKITTSGNSIKLDADNRIITTGKAGVTKFTVVSNDGGKKTTKKFAINIRAEEAYLNLRDYWTYNSLELKENEDNILKYNANNPLVFHADCNRDSGTNAFGRDAIDVKISSKTGVLLDATKTSEKYSAGADYYYIPKAATDEITFTDNVSQKTTVYRIVNEPFSIPAKSPKLKNNQVTLYTTMYTSMKIRLELDGNVNSHLLECPVTIVPSAEKYWKDTKTQDSYTAFSKLKKQASLIEEDGRYYVEIMTYSGDFPTGTYTYDIVFQTDENGSEFTAPMQVTFTVKKCPAPTVKLSQTISEEDGKKCAKFSVTGKNVSKVEVKAVRGAFLGNTMYENNFNKSFYWTTEESDVQVFVQPGVDLAKVKSGDKQMRIIYNVTDLSGKVYTKAFKVKCNLK